MDLDDLWDFALPSEPAISPDGEWVVYVLRTTDRGADKDRRSLWIVPVDGGSARALTDGITDTSPAWSPDGRRLAFVRDGALWTMDLLDSEPEQVAAIAGAPAWSPDGSRIAFSTVPDGPGRGEASGPIVTDGIGSRLDGVGVRHGGYRQVHVLDLESGALRQLTTGARDAGDPAWSPDGARLAFVTATDPSDDRGLATAAHVVDMVGHPAVAGPDSGMVEAAVWTPDGAGLLLVGSRSVRIGHLGLLHVVLDGSAPVADLAARLDRNVRPGIGGWHGGLPQVACDGRTAVFCVNDHGGTHAYTVDLLEPGAPLPLVAGPGVVISGLSLAAGVDRAAAVIGGPATHGEIVVFDLAGRAAVDVRTLTAHTATSLPGVAFVEPQERTFPITDGTEVQGWVVRDARTTGPSPLYLDVHGGPHLSWGANAEPAHPYHQVLAARGWTVLLINPRASDGYGERFYRACLGAWGHGDERDLIEPVEQLVAEGIADPAQLVVGGYSYGGFMTCHLTTRTDMFRAAVVGGGFCDLVSGAGTGDLSPLYTLMENGAYPWDDPALVREQSPIERVHQVATPTLLLHGMLDDRCPVGQAEQWFTALRVRGVPVQLVRYPGASHQFMAEGRPSDRIDYSRRIVEWATGAPQPAGTTAAGPAMVGVRANSA